MKCIIVKILIFICLNVPKSIKIYGYLERIVAKLDGGTMYSVGLREVYKKKYGIIIGYGSYGGCFSTKNVPKDVTFGNYCSIAQNIRIFRANHPATAFTTHPLLYNSVAGYVEKDMLDRLPLTIGHDVWIGEWVTILPSVKKIGNGAIIGAGSVVTKDVPAYTIVAGNPAKAIRMRFSEEIIEKLEATQWWNWDKEELINNMGSLESIVNGG
jgi:acetyltransferase-like isoleucine patch superfamily enzyme